MLSRLLFNPYVLGGLVILALLAGATIAYQDWRIGQLKEKYSEVSRQKDELVERERETKLAIQRSVDSQARIAKDRDRIAAELSGARSVRVRIPTQTPSAQSDSAAFAGANDSNACGLSKEEQRSVEALLGSTRDATAENSARADQCATRLTELQRYVRENVLEQAK